MIEAEIKLKISDKIDKTDKTDKIDKTNKTNKTDKTNKTARTDKPDKSAVLQTLLSLGFKPASNIRETDSYFDNSEGMIRQSGEALRVRTITDLNSGTETTVITFKGKKLDHVSMTRQELETGVASADTMVRIFEAIGFQIIPPQVIKTRQEYKKEEMTACLDTVEGLGDFLELEIVLEEDQDKEEALRRIGQVLEKIGYKISDTTTNSYLSMLQGVTD